MLTNVKPNLRDYIVVVIICGFVLILAFVIRPHDCKSTYGPAPYHYNTDLTLWISLADKPIGNLKGHILANRPLFAYLGWLFAQPVRLLVDDISVSSPTRAGGITSVKLATIAGLLIANAFSFALTSLLLYGFTYLLTNDRRISLLSSILWSTSSYAFAWSYHPVNQMGGLVLVFGFLFFLWLLRPDSGYKKHTLFSLAFGVLLMMKAYYILPFIYLLWGIVQGVRLRVLLMGFVVFFIPMFLWQRAYELVTGDSFVDYHLGEAGVFGFLTSRLLSVNGLQDTIRQLTVNLVNFPKVMFNSAGPIVTISVIGFYMNPVHRKRYRRLFTFASIYVPLFFLFLTLGGFFIPRHGSDFFPVIYPAASVLLHEAFSAIKQKAFLYVFLLTFVAFTLISYTQAWICAAEFL